MQSHPLLSRKQNGLIMILAGFLACSELKSLPILKIWTVANEVFNSVIELTAAGTAPDFNGIPFYRTPEKWCDHLKSVANIFYFETMYNVDSEYFKNTKRPLNLLF